MYMPLSLPLSMDVCVCVCEYVRKYALYVIYIKYKYLLYGIPVAMKPF